MFKAYWIALIIIVGDGSFISGNPILYPSIFDDISAWTTGPIDPIKVQSTKSYFRLPAGTDPCIYTILPGTGPGIIDFMIQDTGACVVNGDRGNRRIGPHWGVYSSATGNGIVAGIYRDSTQNWCRGYSMWELNAPDKPVWFKDGIRGSKGVAFKPGWHRWTITITESTVSFIIHNVEFYLEDGDPPRCLLRGNCKQTMHRSRCTGPFGQWDSFFIRGDGITRNDPEEVSVQELSGAGSFKGLFYWDLIDSLVIKHEDTCCVCDYWEVVDTGAGDCPACNHLPFITSVPINRAYVDSLYQYQVTAEDKDPADVIGFSLANGPEGMTINSTTGMLEWTPHQGQIGVWTVTIKAEDGRGNFYYQDYLLHTLNGSSPWHVDSLAVYAILQANSYAKNKTVASVTRVDNGRVTELNLPSTLIQVIPDDIRNLTRLKVLNLAGNQIRFLPAALGELGQLTELKLERNGLRALPPEIGNLANLVFLNVNENILSRLPKEIGKLSNLETFLAEQNSLIELPAEIGNLTSLTKLGLCTNNLLRVPPEIGNLKNLTMLSLYSNKYTHLPAEFGNLTLLTSLVLEHTNLVSLPATIGNLTEVYYARIQNTRLRSIPKEIGNLKKLEYLYLSDNELDSLPEEIGLLPQLGHLTVSGNNLTRIPAGIGSLPRLTMLGLSRNKLGSLPDEIANIDSLKSLGASKNKLQAIPQALGSMPRLGGIDVSFNLISYLPPEITEFNVPVYIKYNRLCNVDPAIKAWLDAYDSTWAATQYCGTGWQTDSIIVQKLLDTNNITDIGVYDVMQMRNDTLAYLGFFNSQISIIPEEITVLEPEYCSFDRNRICGISDTVRQWLHTYDRDWEYIQYCGEWWQQDSAIVEKILEVNGLTDYTVFDVTRTERGRIVDVDLGGYGIIVIPPEISGMSGLQWLELDNNYLVGLPKEIMDLSLYIYIQNNYLCQVSPEMNDWLIDNSTANWQDYQLCAASIMGETFSPEREGQPGGWFTAYPVKGRIHIQCNMAEPDRVAITFHSLKGRTVWEKHDLIEDFSEFAIATTPLPSGIYILKAVNGNKHVALQKVIVVH